MVLNNWSLVYSDPIDPYTPPETIRKSLIGERSSDGKKIRTSDIIRINGREVTTKNTTYTLGTMDNKYLDWIKQNVPTYEFDRQNPIKYVEVDFSGPLALDGTSP